MEFKDYYATLGVAKDASEKEVKQAYRKLARKYHPDVNPGNASAESMFKSINEAYEVIGNPDRRRKYDELGANWRAYEQTGATPGAGPFSAGWSSRTGGPAGAYTAYSVDDLNEAFGADSPFSDFFQTFFGGQPRPDRPKHERGSRSRRGKDLEQEIELTLEEALSGAMRRLSIKHDGHARTVDVRIPAGVGDGAKVRVAGEGQHGMGGGRSGDMYLRVHLAAHPRFERNGRDLTTRTAIGLTTAVLGGEAEVTTIDGHVMRLRVPPGTQPGQVLRVRGSGMPGLGKSPERGDLYVQLDVRLPRQLSPEQRQLFEALAHAEDGTAPSH